MTDNFKYVSEIQLPSDAQESGDTDLEKASYYKIKDAEAVERSGDTMNGNLGFVPKESTPIVTSDEKIRVGVSPSDGNPGGIWGTARGGWVINTNNSKDVFIAGHKITNSNKNLVFATSANTNGTDASLRALVADDIPELNANKITDGTLSTDRLPIVPTSKGGTGRNFTLSASNVGKVIKVVNNGTEEQPNYQFSLQSDIDTNTWNQNLKNQDGYVLAPTENNHNTVWREGTGNPQWGKVTLTTMVEGVLPAANGGTGINLSNQTSPAGKILKVNSNGTGFTLANDENTTYGINNSTTNGLVSKAGTNLRVWGRNGDEPGWVQVNLGTNMVTGTLSVGHGGTGHNTEDPFTSNYVLLGNGTAALKEISQDNLRKWVWARKVTSEQYIIGTDGDLPEEWDNNGWNIIEFYLDNTNSIFHAFGIAAFYLAPEHNIGYIYTDPAIGSGLYKSVLLPVNGKDWDRNFYPRILSLNSSQSLTSYLGANKKSSETLGVSLAFDGQIAVFPHTSGKIPGMSFGFHALSPQPVHFEEGKPKTYYFSIDYWYIAPKWKF